MTTFPAAFGLSPEQVENAIELAGRAPSVHNCQPWRFRVTTENIDLCLADEVRLPAADPDGRELRLSCGAALFNLRLALEHHGVRPHVTLLPSGDHQDRLASVRAHGRAGFAAERHARLVRAIEDRRTNRRPFLPDPVPTTDRHALVGAAERELATLTLIDRDRRPGLLRLVHRAHEAQMADEAFLAEMRAWTGLTSERPVGVPASAAGPRPEVQDEWVLRDFSAGHARQRTPGKDYEDDPLTAVLWTTDATRTADVRAGQALQCTLLTATSLGLATSFLAQVVEVERTRSELIDLLGGQVTPHTVLRIGYGPRVPRTPRHAPRDLLLGRDETARPS